MRYFRLPPRCKMWSAIFWDFTRRRKIQMFRENLSVQSSVKRSLPMKMGPISWPETYLRNFHSTLRKIPKQRRSLSVNILKMTNFCHLINSWAYSSLLFVTRVLQQIQSHILQARPCNKWPNHELLFSVSLSKRRIHCPNPNLKFNFPFKFLLKFV
jgi:hypothetical protein